MIKKYFWFLLVCFISFSCKENNINVRLLDSVSKQGIEGEVFYFGEDRYVTNSDGEIEIESTKKIKDGSITTTLTRPEYLFEKAIENCEHVSSFDVTSGMNIIYARKLSFVKFSTNFKNGVESLCIGPQDTYVESYCGKLNSCYSTITSRMFENRGELVISYVQNHKVQKLAIVRGVDIGESCLESCTMLESEIDTVVYFESTYGDTSNVHIDF